MLYAQIKVLKFQFCQIELVGCSDGTKAEINCEPFFQIIMNLNYFIDERANGYFTVFISIMTRKYSLQKFLFSGRYSSLMKDHLFMREECEEYEMGDYDILCWVIVTHLNLFFVSGKDTHSTVNVCCRYVPRFYLKKKPILPYILTAQYLKVET